ncbi:hypothetical protein V8B97DRAFT_1919971 [Scleroderma yunnanense]
MSQWPWQSKANLHPGHILCNFEIHRHTSEQKKADDKACQQAKDNQAAELQKSYNHIGTMENAMAERQVKEFAEALIKPLKPHPRLVKKLLGAVSGQAQGQYPFHIEDFTEKFNICSWEHHPDNIRAEVAAKQAHEFPFTITMLLLTKSTLHFLNLKLLFSKDVKTTIKGCIKNWNDVVVLATVPNVCPPSLPSCWTPLSSYISPIEPPTPSNKANYEECFRMLPSPKAMDDMAVVIENKGNDLVVSAMVPKACPSSFPHHWTLLSSHVSPIEPPTPSDEANYEECFRMLSSPKAMLFSSPKLTFPDWQARPKTSTLCHYEAY